jgi:hypothetical protein
MKKILIEKCFGRKFCWFENFLLQNHFLGNSLDENQFDRKILWSKILFGRKFFCCIIVSSESLDEKYFGRKIFLLKFFFVENFFVAKSLFRKI